MPILFMGNPGRVIQLDDPAAQCDAQIKIDPDIGYQTQRSIVTRLTVNQQVNVQFLHSLGALIYIYVFGDRMGQVGLSGLAFSCPCPSGESGAGKMLEWYKQNRASKRQAPVQVTIAGTTVEGFVINFSEDVVDPSLKLIQWGANMASLPEDS